MNIFEEDEGNEAADKAVILPGWYSFGIIIDKHDNCFELLDKIALFIKELKEIEKWFFLYEGDRLAIRIKPKKRITRAQILKKIKSKIKKNNLEMEENSFCLYKEKIGKLFNEETIFSFAEIMVQTTKLWCLKREFKTNFSNYRFMERVSHCMFNVLCGNFIHGLKTEHYFLHQRILERTKCIFDEEFEDSNIPRVKLKKYL